ncbi:hypothetical protein IV500_04285 [Paeniglutamicibacter antarcticus]|uniref:Uncharacterized protein n=1 Tax=Arthrobacter terrae TaxID=2935737 RepID=A0A931CPJ0_9MICC|nr:hypothetical protein [Arthrobacter terrae]MBG0738639.1 hypothetical protein [Arthrobacter terrae]
MNEHYKAAVNGLNLMKEITGSGAQPTEAMTMTAILAQATLAVAEEQAKANANLETANLIAYTQLCRLIRKQETAAAALELADQRMSAFPEIKAALAENASY